MRTHHLGKDILLVLMWRGYLVLFYHVIVQVNKAVGCEEEGFCNSDSHAELALVESSIYWISGLHKVVGLALHPRLVYEAASIQLGDFQPAASAKSGRPCRRP